MTSKHLEMPAPAELRKRRLWQEMIHWLRIELNSRFSLPLHEREDMDHLEDMAATIINSGEVFDKDIQKQLEQCEKAIMSADSLALRTPVFVNVPAEWAMSPADIVALYDRLAGIKDHIEYGADGYVRFGSGNDADEFCSIVEEVESRRNQIVFPKVQP